MDGKGAAGGRTHPGTVRQTWKDGRMMFAKIADFLLGAALARRIDLDHAPNAPLRSPSRARAAHGRHAQLGWIARVGTY